jgi:hypothetical protein
MDEEMTDHESERLFLVGDRLSGEGNHREAWRAFLRAARRGHAASQLNLGVMYSDGRGVRRSRSKARRWFLKAFADRSSAAAAANNLGLLYLERGSNRRGRQWLERAIALGDDDSRLHLGHLMLAVYGEISDARVQFCRLESAQQATEVGQEAAHNWRAIVEGLMALQSSVASP